MARSRARRGKEYRAPPRRLAPPLSLSRSSYAHLYICLVAFSRPSSSPFSSFTTTMAAPRCFRPSPYLAFWLAPFPNLARSSYCHRPSSTTTIMGRSALPSCFRSALPTATVGFLSPVGPLKSSSLLSLPPVCWPAPPILLSAWCTVSPQTPPRLSFFSRVSLALSFCFPRALSLAPTLTKRPSAIENACRALPTPHGDACPAHAPLPCSTRATRSVRAFCCPQLHASVALSWISVFLLRGGACVHRRRRPPAELRTHTCGKQLITSPTKTPNKKAPKINQK